MRILGIIPARGGSKGIPNKNLKLLNDKPLLQYTIEAANKAKYLDELILSSEDENIISIAKELGVKVPFIRPPHLATDTAGSLEVVQHAIHFYQQKKETYDAICLLQATVPFRTSADIDRALEMFIKKKPDALISVEKIPHQYNPHWAFKADNENNLVIATGDEKIIKRRQELPEAYVRDGAIYITRTEVIMDQNSFLGNKTAYIELNNPNSINIDTPEDWERAEEIIKTL
ncbi:NTP transferase domain-containing protein [Flavobacteriaceae bacterium R38]|nr:NTP transferase domain-containing protein [Flavobacteriaceae bacterium R38]